MVDEEPQYRTLMSVDVEASGGRSDTGSEHLRGVVTDALEAALDAAGIDVAACELADTGDGIVAHVPAGIAKTRLIRKVLPDLADRLRHHNREASPANHVRVRASIHAGDLRRDKRGLTGKAKVVLARQLGDGQVRRVLAQAPPTATVVAVVSEPFYRDVIEPGNIGIDPARFHEITVPYKETDDRPSAQAWLTVVGHAGPVDIAEQPKPASTPAPVSVTNTGSINFGSGATLNFRDMVNQKNVYGEERRPMS